MLVTQNHHDSNNLFIFSSEPNEIFVASERAAKNMSFQDILPKNPTCLCQVHGTELLGLRILPLPAIKMDKGTGIVTSVTSDSPDDYAAFTDLKNPANQSKARVLPERGGTF